jgi:aldehyde dehydrogenase (NAD+)
MKKAGDLLVEKKEEMARLMTREMGKVIMETRGDVQEAIDTAYYAAGEGRRWWGHTVPSELSNKIAYTKHEPVGIAALITPWNFPSAIPAWKLFPALLCGNGVVFKPASDTPLSATLLVEILIEAGVHPQTLNLVHGSGKEAGAALTSHPEVNLVSFTGSTVVGRSIASECGRGLKQVSLEMGGKNGQVILNDADLDLALEGLIWGAFGTTGQRCTASSRLILEEGIHDKFVEMFKARVESLKVGNGLDESVEMGPVINESQRDIIHNYIQIGSDEGAKLITGGEVLETGECKKGFFYKPTIFTDVTPEMRIAKEEIFGPVVSVIRARDFEQAIEILNNTDYGLSSALYTRDLNLGMKAIESIKTGVVYLNSSTIGAECHLPFGGYKETGNGHREGGWTAFEIFSECKTVYIDYSGALQRAQIDVPD